MTNHRPVINSSAADGETHPATWADLRHETPFLAVDLPRVAAAYHDLSAALPGTSIKYAMKANAHPQLLETLADLGAGFVVASIGELEQLQVIRPALSDILYSNPVKPATHIALAYGAGVRRFAFDSHREAEKIARAAPGSSVFVRLQTRAATSDVPSEGKFGVRADRAVSLMLFAAGLGLDPFGVTFHVGSQMTRPGAWATAITQCAEIMDRLSRHGVSIRMVDIGGGFPVRYAYPDETPAIATIGAHITSALADLPYRVETVAEPGRFLVAEAGVIVATVIGIADRATGRWVHLDVGAFNGLMESLETRNALRYPITDSRSPAPTQTCHLTGPTCDTQDSIMSGVELSAGLEVGDRVYIGSAGAYTTCYAATAFNGFAAPGVHIVEPAPARHLEEPA